MIGVIFRTAEDSVPTHFLQVGVDSRYDAKKGGSETVAGGRHRQGENWGMAGRQLQYCGAGSEGSPGRAPCAPFNRPIGEAFPRTYANQRTRRPCY